MGHKPKCKDNELVVKHIISNINIKTAKCCQNCPLKIYAKENDKIIFGVGNIFSNTIIILPSYNVNAKIEHNTILKILQDAYKDITGTDVLEDCYVTRSIKCLNKTDFNLDKEAIKSCISNLYYEIGRILPKKLIIFDKNINDYYMCNSIQKSFIIKNVISPGVMYYNNQGLKDTFIKQLKIAINDF